MSWPFDPERQAALFEDLPSPVVLPKGTRLDVTFCAELPMDCTHEQARAWLISQIGPVLVGDLTEALQGRSYNFTITISGR